MQCGWEWVIGEEGLVQTFAPHTHTHTHLLRLYLAISCRGTASLPADPKRMCLKQVCEQLEQTRWVRTQVSFPAIQCVKRSRYSVNRHSANNPHHPTALHSSIVSCFPHKLIHNHQWSEYREVGYFTIALCDCMEVKGKELTPAWKVQWPFTTDYTS